MLVLRADWWGSGGQALWLLVIVPNGSYCCPLITGLSGPDLFSGRRKIAEILLTAKLNNIYSLYLMFNHHSHTDVILLTLFHTVVLQQFLSNEILHYRSASTRGKVMLLFISIVNLNLNKLVEIVGCVLSFKLRIILP